MSTEPTAPARLLIVDDDEAIRNQMKWAFASDYELAFAWDSDSVDAALANFKPAVIALDLGLPPDPRNASEGLRLLRHILQTDARVQVIVITGNPDKENALKAIELGATDFYAKPVDLDELAVSIRRAHHIHTLENELADSRSQTGGSVGQMVGQSRAMEKVFRLIRRVAPSQEPVLIEGPSGTGKEMVAQALHDESLRQRGPFVPVNCGAIPESLFEGELFGHEAGAFTDAKKRRAGLAEQAHKGTLFLDEIGELPLSVQPKLLRFLQSGVVQRLGGGSETPVDARIISATNRNLEEMVHQGLFREDLYYRIKVVAITLPALCDRADDIPPLAQMFLRRCSSQLGSTRLQFGDGVMDAMTQYSWPGNVRELENRIRSAAVMAEGETITLDDLQLAQGAVRLLPIKAVREAAERAHIEMALAVCNHNVTQTAKALEVSRPTLHALINKLDIRVG